MDNSAAAILAQEEARKQFKAKWTITACKEVGQKLHDLIKLGGDIFNKSPYLGRQPLVCKRNQQISMAKVKAKHARKKNGTPMPTFELPLLLPHFHGVREDLLERGIPLHLIRPAKFPPWMFCILPPDTVSQGLSEAMGGRMRWEAAGDGRLQAEGEGLGDGEAVG